MTASSPIDAVGLRLPDHTPLALLPTPVEPLERLSAELGVRILVKRDDLTGLDLTGNKVRKLEYLLAEATRQEATCVLTTGAVQSNHCRATAIACRKLGIEPYLLLRAPDGREPTEVDGNHLLDRMVGARIRTIPPEAWPQRAELLAEWAAELEGAGEKAYVIPEGASNALGSIGYVTAVEELIGQLRAKGYPSEGLRETDYLVHACGSGGTTAGIAIGARLYWKNALPVAMAVTEDAATFRTRISGIAADFAASFGGITGPDDLNYLVLDQYKGIGYGLSTPEELQFIRGVAKLEGLILDPVYTGKAFYGMVQEIRAGQTFRKGSTVVFVHTGGIFGLFPKRHELFPDRT